MSAEPGSVVIVGNRLNGVTATKQTDGTWLTNMEPRRVVSPEDIGRTGLMVFHVPTELVSQKDSPSSAQPPLGN